MPRLGLSESLGQFSLLLLINAFAGVMVGMEHTVVPLPAEREFGIASRTAILAFLVTFGGSTALANLFVGAAADRLGRKRTPIAGWRAGGLTDAFGISVSVEVIGAITLVSGLVVATTCGERSGRMTGTTLPAWCGHRSGAKRTTLARLARGKP